MFIRALRIVMSLNPKYFPYRPKIVTLNENIQSPRIITLKPPSIQPIQSIPIYIGSKLHAHGHGYSLTLIICSNLSHSFKIKRISLFNS